MNKNLAAYRVETVFALHAATANGKISSHMALRLAALTALNVLKKRAGAAALLRLRDLPGPEKFRAIDDAALGNMCIDHGWSAEVLSRLDKGVWALRLNEPETGDSAAGRVVTTRVAFRDTGDRLECGFRVDDAVPEGAPATHSLELPNALLALMTDPNCGLCCGEPLTAEPRTLDTAKSVEALADLLKNAANPLPCIVFIPGTPAQIDTTAAASAEGSGAPWRDLLALTAPEKPALNGAELFAQLAERPPKDFFNNMPVLPDGFLAQKDELPSSLKEAILSTPPGKLKKIAKRLRGEEKASVQIANDGAAVLDSTRAEADDLAAALLARTRVYVLDPAQRERFNELCACTAEPGDVLTLCPAGMNEPMPMVSGRVSGEKRAAALADLKARLLELNRARAPRVDFGSVDFEPAPRVVPAPREDTEKLAALEREYKAKLEREQSRARAALKSKEKEIHALNEQLNRQKEYIARLTDEKEQLRAELAVEAARLKYEEAEKDEEIACLRRRLDRPNEHSRIAEWVRRYFRGRLILHPRAEALLEEKSSRDVDVGLICDALDFLATDWWSRRYEQISSDEMNTRCSKKYGRPFTVRPTGKMTVGFTPVQYKIKYFIGARGKPVESPLDFHLGVGNDPENLLRIYFLHDDEKKLIVVGSLPRHLRAITIE